MTPEQMEALDERPERRFTSGGVVHMEYAEQRSRARTGCRCEKCKTAVVTDAEWRTICDLHGIEYDAGSTGRVCPPCVAESRKLDRWLDAECERLAARDRDRRSRRPPIGLRVVPRL